MSCRSGARARALAVATAVDASAEVAAWLAAGWGIGGEATDVRFERRYDEVRDAAPWFDVSMTALRPIGAGDVQFVTSLHPVITDAGERLVQVELEVAVDRVERGRPVLHPFTAPAGAAASTPFPVAATCGLGTWTLPRVRFVLRPDVPPNVGMERIEVRSGSAP